MKLIHIIAPAVLEGDVNISKLFIASVPWFMKQCMQTMFTDHAKECGLLEDCS